MNLLFYSRAWYIIIVHNYAAFLVTLFLGKNIVLVSTFWVHSQFNPYILITVNLVHVIFNL